MLKTKRHLEVEGLLKTANSNCKTRLQTTMDVNWGRNHAILFVGKAETSIVDCSQLSFFSHFYSIVELAVRIA